MLHALSDPARLEIVRRLAEGDEPSCGTFELGLSKATLSHHFRVLRESGVVRTRPDGRKRLLSLRSAYLDARFPGLQRRGAGGQALGPGAEPGRGAGLDGGGLSRCGRRGAGRLAQRASRLKWRLG